MAVTEMLLYDMTVENSTQFSSTNKQVLPVTVILQGAATW